MPNVYDAVPDAKGETVVVSDAVIAAERKVSRSSNNFLQARQMAVDILQRWQTSLDSDDILRLLLCSLNYLLPFS